VGRVLYAVMHARDAQRRGAGFPITLLALSALLVQGGWGIAKALLAA
jgi:hypothetical protein